MPAASLQKFNNSSSSTATASTPSTGSTGSPVHEIIISAKAAGLQLNASTLSLVTSWLRAGLPVEVITGYIIPETALAPRPSIRYAAAIAKRLIAEGVRTLEQAEAPKPTYDQREYEERKPGELPAWLREMMAEEAAALK